MRMMVNRIGIFQNVMAETLDFTGFSDPILALKCLFYWEW